MSPTTLKVGFLLIGLGTWYWGYRVDDATIRWLGIAFFAAAFFLRFLDRGRKPPGTDQPGGA